MLSQNPQSFTISKVSEPFNLAYKLGAEDARDGNPFAPEMYFTHLEDKQDYARGYESVKGISESTVQFTGSALPKPAAVPHYKRDGKEFLRITDLNAEKVFKASEKRAKRIARAMAETAAITGIDDGQIYFA